MSIIKNAVVASLLAVLSAPVYADWMPSLEVADLTATVGGEVYVGFKSQPTNSCLYWSWHVKFDGTTAAGKNLMAVFLTAKTTVRKVNMWYYNTTAPGTNHTNGCNTATMARVDMVTLS